MHIAAASKAPMFLSVPAIPPGPALQAVWPALLLGFLLIDLDVASQARSGLGHGKGIHIVLCRPADGALSGHGFPDLWVGFLHRLREDTNLLQGRGSGHNRAAYGVQVRLANRQHVLHMAPSL